MWKISKNVTKIDQNLNTSHDLILQGYLKALGMARTAEVKRDARIGEAEAKRDAQIKEAIAEEERMASRSVRFGSLI